VIFRAGPDRQVAPEPITRSLNVAFPGTLHMAFPGEALNMAVLSFSAHAALQQPVDFVSAQGFAACFGVDRQRWSILAEHPRGFGEYNPGLPGARRDDRLGFVRLITATHDVFS